MSSGIVLRQDNPVARSKAAKCGVAVAVRTDWALPWQRTLFIAPNTCVPWDLLAVGFDFLARWDVAAPFWRTGVLATNVGTPAERERTARIMHDLRVPVYSHELLFVSNNQAGQALVSTWRAECAQGDERLAFLRALYIVKPTFCVLPRLWLADLAQRTHSDEMARSRTRERRGEPLIRVEVAPGRYVQCHARDKEQVLARFQRMGQGRRHG